MYDDEKNSYDESMDTFIDENSDEEEQKISEYYNLRRLQKHQMERKIRQSKIWFERWRTLLRIIIVAFMIYAGYRAVHLHYWYLNKNIFNTGSNNSLEIVNNKIVPQNRILNALRRTNLPITPIYKLETEEIKQNIMQLDPIENVYVRRFWLPARLQIIIKEKTPIITISPGATIPPIAFFAKDGTLIGRDYLPLSPNFKTTLVLSYGNKGDDYRHWQIEKIKLIERFSKITKNYSGEDVQYIDFRNPTDVYVKIPSANIRIGTFDESAVERVKRISSILPQVKMLDKPIKYIDLRWKDANYIKLADANEKPAEEPKPENANPNQ